MALSMMENGKIAKEKDTVFNNGLMALGMKVLGNKINQMAREN
jgi:hypothetical protein